MLLTWWYYHPCAIVREIDRDINVKSGMNVPDVLEFRKSCARELNPNWKCARDPRLASNLKCNEVTYVSEDMKA